MSLRFVKCAFLASLACFSAFAPPSDSAEVTDCATLIAGILGADFKELAVSWPAGRLRNPQKIAVHRFQAFADSGFLTNSEKFILEKHVRGESNPEIAEQLRPTGTAAEVAFLLDSAKGKAKYFFDLAQSGKDAAATAGDFKPWVEGQLAQRNWNLQNLQGKSKLTLPETRKLAELLTSEKPDPMFRDFFLGKLSEVFERYRRAAIVPGSFTIVPKDPAEIAPWVNREMRLRKWSIHSLSKVRVVGSVREMLEQMAKGEKAFSDFTEWQQSLFRVQLGNAFKEFPSNLPTGVPLAGETDSVWFRREMESRGLLVDGVIVPSFWANSRLTTPGYRAQAEALLTDSPSTPNVKLVHRLIEYFKSNPIPSEE